MKTIEFKKHGREGYTEPLAGILQKTLVFGDSTLMAEFVLAKGKTLPMHDHPYEQTEYLVKGRILLTLGDKQYETFPGDAWCIPPHVSHGAKIIEDSVAIEIFSPVRKDYIPQD